MMKMFDVQGIEIKTAHERAFSYIADPTHLPKWTNAFATEIPDRLVGENVIKIREEKI